MSSWHDWYDCHQAVIDRTFGNDSDMFKQILSATSQAASVKSNVGLAVKAYRQMVSDQLFTGYLPAVIKNLDRVRANEALRGPKIGEFAKATTNNTSGSDDAIAVDRHIARLIFGKGQTNAAEKAMAKEVIRTIGAKYGWTGKQAQAVLWAYNQVKEGLDPNGVISYDRVFHTRADEIHSIRTTFSRGEGRSLPAGSDTGRGSPEDEGVGANSGSSQTPLQNAAGKLNASGDAALGRVTARNKGRVSSGIDPADLADMTVYGAAIFAAGVVNLAE